MAVSGGACSAYRCQVQDGQLVAVPTTCLRKLCVAPKDALTPLGQGEWVTVAGSDMVALRRLLVGDEDAGGRDGVQDG
jgi:hypothetical protein